MYIFTVTSFGLFSLGKGNLGQAGTKNVHYYMYMFLVSGMIVTQKKLCLAYCIIGDYNLPVTV